MWVFTETGFVSAVVHRDDETKLMVRARDRKSLDGLVDLAGVKVIDTPTGDYPHRVVVSKDQFQQWVTSSVDEMSYPNFKSRVAVIRGSEFAGPLHDVWDAMHGVEEDPNRKGWRTWDRYEDYEYGEVDNL